MTTWNFTHNHCTNLLTAWSQHFFCYHKSLTPVDLKHEAHCIRCVWYVWWGRLTDGKTGWTLGRVQAGKGQHATCTDRWVGGWLGAQTTPQDTNDRKCVCVLCRDTRQQFISHTHIFEHVVHWNTTTHCDNALLFLSQHRLTQRKLFSCDVFRVCGVGLTWASGRV